MELTVLAQIYSLIAEMEAIKAEIEEVKNLNLLLPIDKAAKFHEAKEQLNGISSELSILGRG